MDLKIGAVAKMTGLSPSGIRFLEEQGLLSPSGGRKGSYRSYSLTDVSTLLDYRNYRKCGLSQEAILHLLRSEDGGAVSAIFERRCDELDMRIIRSLLDHESYEKIEEKYYISSSTLRYRLHKIFSDSGVASRKEFEKLIHTHLGEGNPFSFVH